MDYLNCKCCGVAFTTMGRLLKNGARSCPLPSSPKHPQVCSVRCRNRITQEAYKQSLKDDPAKAQRDKDLRNQAAAKPERVEARRKYTAANKNKQRARYDKFWSNPEKAAKARAQQKQYRDANRAQLSAWDVEYRKRRKAVDPAFRVVTNLRNRVYSAVRAARAGRKTVSGAELLGCTPEFFIQYLEAQFLPGMTWDNYGLHGWHADHIKPVNAFDDPQDPACWHYTNYQPLWAEDNWAKSDNWEPEAA